MLALLLLHPGESFHLREIARLTDTQPGTLRRELALLADVGVLRRERLGNQVRYSADMDCPVYQELRGILKKTAGVADVLRAALAPLANRISAAFVYGSVAGDSERRSSDIDVMIIGMVSFEEAVIALQPCQEQLRREINPNVNKPADFNKQAGVTGSFLSRVMVGPKIFIQGEEHDLKKSGSDRKAKATQNHARGGRKTAVRGMA
ncbi:MAG: nucleotidyltransferase domain-containing protein [Gammaproteobacteria bacterium]